jgi:hypothetical protein
MGFSRFLPKTKTTKKQDDVIHVPLFCVDYMENIAFLDVAPPAVIAFMDKVRAGPHRNSKMLSRGVFVPISEVNRVVDALDTHMRRNIDGMTDKDIEQIQNVQHWVSKTVEHPQHRWQGPDY